jgi:hypothetical protein
MKISLRLAPDVFFDSEKWDQFIRQFESSELALARISVPPAIPGDGYHRADDAGLPAQTHAREVHSELTFQLGMALVGQFKRDLMERVILASGIPQPFGERRNIPPEECGRVWPNFLENTLLGPLFGYSHVTLVANNTRRAVNQRLLQACIDWLQVQAAENAIRKKEDLRRLAKKHFGQDIPVRVFNLAYQRVYYRDRGRPRKKT